MGWSVGITMCSQRPLHLRLLRHKTTFMLNSGMGSLISANLSKEHVIVKITSVYYCTCTTNLPFLHLPCTRQRGPDGIRKLTLHVQY